MFNTLKKQIQDRFAQLQATGLLFYVAIDRDQVWEEWLSGFQNPGERQEHTCNYCKSFIRQFAGIVAIVNNKKETLWDLLQASDLYKQSVDNVHRYVVTRPITDVFRTEFKIAGTPENKDRVKNLVWTHFSLNIPQSYTLKVDQIPSFLGERRDTKNMLKRALDELSMDSLDTVMELIGQGSLYRGNEFRELINRFMKVKNDYQTVPEGLKDNFAWILSVSIPESVCRIKNSSIGTLLTNLSEGMDLDQAVSKFEAMVAPTNYKRPTAIVTPRMVEDAKEKITALGFMDKLNRRFATERDLNVEDVLYVDKSSSVQDVFDQMKKDSQINPKSLTKVEEISIENFIASVIPSAKQMFVLLENSHLSNMTSLLPAETPGAPYLFKWTNDFSWAYTGGITDSIKERVKSAGGNVEGVIRVSLSWFNYDDLDLHVREPRGNTIYFGSKRSGSTGGELDVDMNAGHGKTRQAVENIIWTDASRLEEGEYKVIVNQYVQREHNDQGFVIQVEHNGQTYEFAQKNSPRSQFSELVCTFKWSKKDGFTINGEHTSSVVDKEKWALKTNRFHKVKRVMLSPNHWQQAVGNKHFMFFLEHCSSDEQTRPFFNEFLKGELDTHRKFFEILGSKLKINPPTEQLSGLGFSETQRNHLYVQVDGNFKRTLKIKF